jgi:protein-S-isoprenylcysteine O-methyltransferase Ste14
MQSYVNYISNPVYTFNGVYDFLYNLFFLIDLAYAVLGYSISMRLNSSSVISVEPTVFGWVIALICYQPFWGSIGRLYLTWANGIDAWSILSPYPYLHVLWVILMFILLAVYVLATMEFGPRFSNLTNRGVLQTGVYSWLRHPAYISKNLSWWLFLFPCLSSMTFFDSMRHVIPLFLVSCVYYFRAKAEESHFLSTSPDYLDYMKRVNFQCQSQKLKKAGLLIYQKFPAY